MRRRSTGAPGGCTRASDWSRYTAPSRRSPRRDWPSRSSWGTGGRATRRPSRDATITTWFACIAAGSPPPMSARSNRSRGRSCGGGLRSLRTGWNSSATAPAAAPGGRGRHRAPRPTSAALGVVLALAVAGCDARTTSTPGLAVTATIYPLAEFARRVGGAPVNVHTLIPPGVEAHDYEPTPKDLAALSRARLFIYDGAGFEPWVERLLPQLAKGTLRVNATEGLPLVRGDGGGGPPPRRRPGFGGDAGGGGRGPPRPPPPPPPPPP